MKFKLKLILLFFICCCLVFCYTFFFRGIFADEIWNYGFGYNIASGLIPYKDFNMIVTPLYSFLVACFIKIFGHHLWSMHILCSIIVTLMVFIMYKKIKKKVFIVFPILLLFFYPSYNFFCLFLLLLLFYIIENVDNYNDLCSAFIVSLLFLTKQTVGMVMFVPMIYYSKNKIKSLIVFFVPILLFFLYLLYNDALFNFIDYCFLGMLNFANKNKIYLLFPIEIVVIIILIWKNIKCRFSDTELFYILMFQIITIPIFDFSHCGISFILLFYYFISHINVDSNKIKYYAFILFFTIFIWGYSLIDICYGNHFFSDHSSYLFGRRTEVYIQDSIISVSKYMEEIGDDYKNIFVFSSHAYELKMNTCYKINKFDLINNGNMGYGSSTSYIREIDSICSNEKCLFILYKYEILEAEDKYFQTNIDILNFVHNNYIYKEEINGFEIYVN